jgi:hypothetical protein
MVATYMDGVQSILRVKAPLGWIDAYFEDVIPGYKPEEANFDPTIGLVRTLVADGAFGDTQPIQDDIQDLYEAWNLEEELSETAESDDSSGETDSPHGAKR